MRAAAEKRTPWLHRGSESGLYYDMFRSNGFMKNSAGDDEILLCKEQLRSWFRFPKNVKRVRVIVQKHAKGEWETNIPEHETCMWAVINLEHSKRITIYFSFGQWLMNQGGLSTDKERFKMWVEYDA